MITFKIWLKNIHESISRLSDLSFQNDAWVKGTVMSGGWYEEISNLYDSNSFEDFLNKYQNSIELPPEIANKMHEYHNALEKYEGKEKDEDTINDPRWIEITAIGREIIKLLEKYKLNEGDD